MKYLNLQASIKPPNKIKKNLDIHLEHFHNKIPEIEHKKQDLLKLGENAQTRVYLINERINNTEYGGREVPSSLEVMSSG